MKEWHCIIEVCIEAIPRSISYTKYNYYFYIRYLIKITKVYLYTNLQIVFFLKNKHVIKVLHLKSSYTFKVVFQLKMHGYHGVILPAEDLVSFYRCTQPVFIMPVYFYTLSSYVIFPRKSQDCIALLV